MNRARFTDLASAQLRPHVGRDHGASARPGQRTTEAFVELLGRSLEELERLARWGRRAVLDRELVPYCLTLKELGHGDSSVCGAVSVSIGLVTETQLALGSEKKKQRWLPGLRACGRVGCFGLIEPQAGSDAASLSSLARQSRLVEAS